MCFIGSGAILGSCYNHEALANQWSSLIKLGRSSASMANIADFCVAFYGHVILYAVVVGDIFAVVVCCSG